MSCSSEIFGQTISLCRQNNQMLFHDYILDQIDGRLRWEGDKKRKSRRSPEQEICGQREARGTAESITFF